MMTLEKLNELVAMLRRRLADREERRIRARMEAEGKTLPCLPDLRRAEREAENHDVLNHIHREEK
jgi:hypothetical protein